MSTTVIFSQCREHVNSGKTAPPNGSLGDVCNGKPTLAVCRLWTYSPFSINKRRSTSSAADDSLTLGSDLSETAHVIRNINLFRKIVLMAQILFAVSWIGAFSRNAGRKEQHDGDFGVIYFTTMSCRGVDKYPVLNRVSATNFQPLSKVFRRTGKVPEKSVFEPSYPSKALS